VTADGVTADGVTADGVTADSGMADGKMAASGMAGGRVLIHICCLAGSFNINFKNLCIIIFISKMTTS
jgi:hypothetical protein